MYSIKNREVLGKVEDLASLQNQVEEVRLQDKSGKQKFYENIKKVFEPLTDTIKHTSGILTKTITESSLGNNKAISGLYEKVLELMKDSHLIALFFSFLFS